ncbi:MAG: ssDNA-binding domain-containing protein [Hyphomonadaceae bacterium]|nr:ssDNA-binding domain-containing protein [Hyphomonadaceae bacterium]
MLCVNTPATEPRLTPAARVTSAILEALKRDVRPWTRPWSTNTSISLPLRANGLPYKGVNTIALWAAALEHGYASPYWLTFKQAQALKARVRKGERGAFVVYYGERLVRDDAAEEAPEASARTQRILRGYSVFCADQVEGLPEEFYPSAPASAPLSEREAQLLLQIERIPAIVRHGGNRAYYAPASDAIHLPSRESFAGIGSYLITRLHESAHWTRASSRLDRDFGAKRFGDAGYALEELVAELSAAMVGATLNVPGDHVEDHACYIDSWLKVLESQPSAFLSAAGKAQQACDYLLQFIDAPPPEPPG